MIREIRISPRPGIGLLFLFLFSLLGSVALLITGGVQQDAGLVVLGVLGIIGSIFLMTGLFMVNPNEGKVLQLFGDYKGTVRKPGLRWANPFYSKRAISLRVRNFETGKLKVNDSDGNPVELAAVVVWKVVDTAEAVFEVDDYENFISVQSESALRNLATGYPYVAHQEDEHSLSTHTAEVSEKLQGEIQDRLQKAGIKILEARISHLAYSPEIAAAMLQRQQASAVVAARHQIVEGAVGMVEMALDQLRAKSVVELDEERKAAMISNLLVVLCSDRHTQPVVNTGTLHN